MELIIGGIIALIIIGSQVSCSHKAILKNCKSLQDDAQISVCETLKPWE